MRTIIIVQARMGSTRFPGKILKKVMGRPLLEYQIERLNKVKNVDDVVIATTTNEKDTPVQELCDALKCSYFRGSESDVLSRFYGAAEEFNAECIVRINSDCPLIDPSVVEGMIEHYVKHSDLDYLSNILQKSYPIGLHTEVFSMEVLRKVNEQAMDPLEREHVTPYIYRNPIMFKLFSYAIGDDLSKYRWTVDYPEDFELIRIILEHCYPNKPNFGMFDIIDLMEKKPKLAKINSQFNQQQTV